MAGSFFPRAIAFGLWLLLVGSSQSGFAQDWIKTGTGLGVERIRIAVPEFKASNQDPRNG